MKISLISTIKNEAFSINRFIDSILSQSRLPDEIVIVDGGSTDGTIDIIKSYIGDGKPIKLIVHEGANISQGRNIAIRNASYDFIACSDSGCRLDKNWLSQLTKPFEKESNIDVVAGFYLPEAMNVFEKHVGELTCPKVDKIDPERFLPSARSIAVKKQAWEKVGGYPEWLEKAEDTLFDLNLQRAGCKFYFANDAIAYWRPRKNLKEFYELMRSYSYWEGYAGLFFFRIFVYYSMYFIGSGLLLFGFIWPSLWLLLLIGIIIYFLIPIAKISRNTRTTKSFLIMPILILTRDIGNMLGYAQGIYRRIKHRQ